MGDWRIKRNGLTSNERGIPSDFFHEIILKSGFKIINKSYCWFMPTSRLNYFKIFTKKGIFNSPTIVWMDKLFSYLFSWNKTYHPTSKLQRIQPQSVYYVLKKQ